MSTIVKKFRNIDSITLRKMLEQRDDFLLLDVRTRMEHISGAIEGSVLIPLQELDRRTGELPKDREIVIYCRVGNRSAFAAAYLARLGYTVSNLEGGIMAWSFGVDRAYART